MHQHSPELLPGTRVGPLELLRLLGRGASAHVYLARDHVGRQLAVKVRARGDTALDRRFLREFESLRRLDLPGVVRVHDAGESHGWLWFSMDVVQGESIRHWIASGRGTTQRVARACQAGAALCDALDGIHRAGFIHRDLKPSNVLVAQDGQVRVLDFGVVGWWSAGEPLTGTGGMVGTIPYMAPEQVAGLPPTPAIDIFAAGITLYEGVAGKRPRPARPHALITRQVIERPAPLATRDPAVPAAFSHAMDRALSLDPEERPSAAELAAMLRASGRPGAATDWPEAPVMAGREAELARIAAAFRQSGPRLVVLAGRPGDGRRRLAEQAWREALLDGYRVERGRCRQDLLGGAIRSILRRLLSSSDPASLRHRVAPEDAHALLEMWPDLYLHDLASGAEAGPVDRRQVASAAARLLGVIARGRVPLLLVLADFEDLDPLTARVLGRLLADDSRIGVLAVLDRRWAGRHARRTMDRARTDRQLELIELEPLPAEAATLLARSLASGAPVPACGPMRPGDATLVGLRSLAQRRSEVFRPPPPAASCIAVAEEAMPAAVVERVLGGRAGDWVDAGLLHVDAGGMYRVCGPHLRHVLEAGLEDRRAAHDRLALAWEEWTAGGERRRVPAAQHRIRGHRRGMVAWEAAVRAASACAAEGRYSSARDWLLLLDHMERDPEHPVYRQLRFELASTRCRVAAATDTERVRRDLLEQAAARVTTPVEARRVTLLETIILRREGGHHKAIAEALAAAAAGRQEDPESAALLVEATVPARLELGQPAEALEACRQAEALLPASTRSRHGPRMLASRALSLYSAGDLREAENLVETALATAQPSSDARAHALIEYTCGQVRLRLGLRSEALQVSLQARRTARGNGDRMLSALTATLLGELSAARGDAAGARRLLDEAFATSSRLSMHRTAMEAAAQDALVSLALGEDERTASRLDLLREDGDPALRAAIELHHWRLLRRPDRAQLAAADLGPAGWWACLGRVELARAWLDAGQPRAAAVALDHAMRLAREGGLSELERYARMVGGAMAPGRNPEAWQRLVDSALRAPWLELYLGVLEFDGRRKLAEGESAAARERFEALRIRAADLPHRPYVRTAERLLAQMRTG